MSEKMVGKFFISSRQSRHFDLGLVFCKVLFPICTLTWRLTNYVSRQGKGIKKRMESTDLEL